MHISHLLPGRRALAVGGFGVFERLTIPASYDAATHLLTPPSCRVVFTYDSTAVSTPALIDSISRAHDMDSDAAQRRIAADVAEIEKVLHHSGKFSIEGVGTLSLNSKGEIDFNSASVEDELGISWLEPMFMESLVAEVVETPKAESTETQSADIVAEFERSLFRERIMRIAGSAAAAILIFASIVLFTGLSDNFRQPAESATTASVAKGLRPSVQLPLSADPQQDAHLVLVFRTPEDGCSEARVRPDRVQPSTPPTTTTAATTATASRGVYTMVVASLANRTEAQEFIDANFGNGFELDIVENAGRFRICTLSGNDANTLTASARNAGLYDKYPSAWVCRR